MLAVPYFARNFSTTSLTVGGSVIGLTLTVISIPLAEIVMVGFRKIFLYQLLADPFTGSRYSVSPSSTNHTGKEIFRPEFRPVTVISSSSVEASACLISAIAMRSSFLTSTFRYCSARAVSVCPQRVARTQQGYARSSCWTMIQCTVNSSTNLLHPCAHTDSGTREVGGRSDTDPTAPACTVRREAAAWQCEPQNPGDRLHVRPA